MFCVQCGTAKEGAVAVCATCGHSPAATSAPDVGKRISEAAQDAGVALLRLAPSPTGLLPSVFSSLGEQRALGAGVALGVIFSLASMIAAWIAILRMGIGFQPRMLLSALVVGVVFFASLALAGGAGRKLLRGTGTLGADVFFVGVALQPIALLVIIGSILGGGNFEVIAIAGLLAWAYFMSILYVGVTRLSGVSETFAPACIAVMLLLSLWLSKVVLVAVAGGSNPFRSPLG